MLPGLVARVPYPKALSSLSAGSRYEYAFVATNNGGATQSNTNSFVTLGLPQVLTPGATDVTKTSVTLNIDLNSTGGATYTTGEPFSGTSVPGLLMWMDGDDPDGDGTPNTSNYNLVNGTGWQDKSGNGRHASIVDGSPSFVKNELNGKGVVYFNGTNNAYISSSSSLAAHTENFSIFLISKDEGTGSHSAHVQSPYNNNSWSFGAKQGHTKNVAWFNGWLYPQSQDADSADTTNFHLYQATLTDTDSGNVWLDGQKVMTGGTGANDGTNRKPGQISFGGDNRGNHTRSKCRIAEFIVLNRVVPEAERLKIEGYLTRKWGMMNTMFSAAHPYYSSDPYQPTVTQGGENAAVTFYWGDNNASTNAGSWDHNYSVTGTHGVGVVSNPVTSGLTAGTTYYYTAKAVTSAGTSWGPVETFVPANTALNKYSIPDLALWVDATDLNGDGTTDTVTNGAAVSAWTDKSLTTATVNQATTGNQPTRQTNAFGTKSAVRFDGTNDFLNISSLRASNGEYSAYATVRRVDQSGDNSGYLVGASDWNLMPSSSNAPFPAIVAETKGSSGTLTNLKIGKSTSTTTNDFGGDLGELLIFSRQLTSTEEQKVQGYLAHKWGGTAGLDANHPYKNVAPIFDNKPLIRDLTTGTGPDTIGGISVWFDASDLDADGITDSTASGNISSWHDKSGNDRHALTANGTPELKTTSGPSNGRVVEIRGGDYLPVSGSFFVKDMFFVFRSPPANTVWSGYGGPFGRNPSSGNNLRGSNYITQHNQTYLHNNQYPAEVYKNGTALSGNFNLGTITNYMIVRLIVNDNDTSNNSYHNIGRVTGLQCNLDIAEIVAFNSKVSNADAALVEGYMAVKWGLTSALPSGHNYKSYTSWPDVLITTGQPVSLQILADRNPTSWSASGLASGLSINNSGLISGSVSSLSAFNSTVTASNSDGNDSKSITFGVSKGYRVIDWNQTFAGLVYGDSPLSLTATATGTGDLNYTSSDSGIIEINGTSAIIRGGGAVTLTATAAENSTAFAAVPASHTFSVAKAPLTITGQDLSLSVGDSIPDLNYTVTGWKHSDASAAIGANPAALANLALWLDASDLTTASSTWSDKSGNANHATKNGSPTVATNAQNGLSVMRYSGADSEYHEWTDLTDIRTIFWVIRANSNNAGFLLGDDDTYHLHNSSGTASANIWASYASSNVINGNLAINGTRGINGQTTALNSSLSYLSIVSLKTSGNVEASRFSRDRNSGGRNWNGDLAELVIFNSALTDSEIQKLEGYLAHKWGLSGSLPSNHSHKTLSLTKAPVVTTDATSSSSAGTYYIRPGDAVSKKYSFTYVDGSLVLSSLTGQTIAWGQSFSNVGVGQTVDLNASVASGLTVLYSVSDTSVAELAVTNQSSLQAWYKLDETSGDASDSSVNSNVGSLRNGPTYTAGKFGNAITLDGTNDHIRTYGFTGSKLDSGSNEIGVVGGNRRTVALWFKTSTANKTILQYGASGTATLFKLSLNNSGAVVLDLGGSTITSSTSSHANGAWHHVAVTIPANGKTGESKLYVNGSRTNGSGSTSINTASSADLIIGRDGTSGSSYFAGQIDDVRFYGAELNATLIGQLYGNGNGDFNRLKVLIAGSVTLTANQPGNAQYATAPASTITATFNKSDQTISFSPIPDKSVGDFDFSPTAVASSGLPVTFSSSDSLIAQIQGTAPNQTIKIRAAGTATITASQSGDGAYNTAPTATQTITVGFFNLQKDSFPGIRLWLDANNIDGDSTADSVTTGTSLIQWIDKSGNTNNAGQSTEANRPIYTILNTVGHFLYQKPVLKFENGDSLDISSDSSVRTIAAIIRQSINQNASTKPFGGNQFLTSSSQKFTLGVMDSNIPSTSFSVLVWQMVPGNYALHVNGTNKGTSTSTLLPAAFDKVGNDLNGHIAEVVAYDRGLSDGVRQKLEGYLAHKWGLVSTLPSTHSYKAAKPAFGGNQVLTFQPIPDKQVGQSTPLDVSSDSGLTAFTFDSNDSSVVSFTGNTVTGLKVGKVTITASQAGQSPWLSATASQPFIVTATPRVDQTITFIDIPDKTVLSSNFDLNATASSGLPVSFAVISGTSATVESNGTVTIAGAGVTTVRASQDGNGSYNPAPTVEKTLTVSKVAQTITFNSLSDASLQVGTYSLNATASSGLSVSFISSDNTVAELSGSVLTLKKGGSITITATQGGNTVYLPATNVTQPLTVIDDTQQAQTISWSQSLGSRAFGVADLNLTASTNSNLPITYISSDSSIASIVNGTFLKVVGAGNATITATQSGNGQYQAASAVSKSLTVTKANQTIVTNGGSTTLPNLTKDNGDFEFAPALKSVKTGTTTSTGLFLTFTSSNSGVIEVTSGGTRLKPKGDGTATITVTQNGDATYNVASNNNVTFTITVTEQSPYPDSLPGMILWLDGNDINADGLAEANTDFITNGSKTQASTWADRSGSSNTLSQGTTNLQPVRVVSSGKAGLAFGSTQGNTGAHMTATMPSILAGNPSFTVFVAAKTSGTQAEKMVHFGNLAGTAGQVLGMAKNGGYYFNGGGELTFPSVNFSGNIQVGAFRRKANATYADGEFFFNGTTQIGSSQSGTSVPAIPSSGSRELLIGAGRTSTGSLGNQLGNAVIHEIMLFSGELTDFAVRRMEGYLAHKWGSNARLASAHPFKSTRPLFGGSQTISVNPTNIPVDTSDNIPFISLFDSPFDLEGAYATSGLPLTFESNNTSILSVNSSGLLKPEGQGKVRITVKQLGNSYFSAATPVIYNMKILGQRSQAITFTTVTEISLYQSLTLSATSTSNLDCNFSIVSGGSITNRSGSTLTFSDTGSVTVRASQGGNNEFAPALSVDRTFLVKRPIKLIFDSIGNMATGQSFTVRAVVMDQETDKPVPVVPTYSIVSGPATINNDIITCGSSTGSVTVRAVANGTEYIGPPQTATFTINNLQGQIIIFKQGEKGGLRDLPISRKPIPIGFMATNSSNRNITFTLGANDIVEWDVPDAVNAPLIATGSNASLVFKKSFKKFDNGVDKVKITVTATSPEVTGSFNAASAVVREFHIVKPSSTAFFDERRMDPRYDAVKAKFTRKLLSKAALKGLIDLDGDGSITTADAELLFDSDDYDSDGDGMSNFMERAFGGDSLSNDSKSAKPKPIMKKDGKQRLGFLKYNSGSNSEGIEYIVERSTDLRTWIQWDQTAAASNGGIDNGIKQVDLDTNDNTTRGKAAGGGMERVLFETTATAGDIGGAQYLRVRARTK
jgi:hypothetical protein